MRVYLRILLIMMVMAWPSCSCLLITAPLSSECFDAFEVTHSALLRHIVSHHEFVASLTFRSLFQSFDCSTLLSLCFMFAQ